MSGWKIRPQDADEYDLPSLYAGRPTMCTLNFHHGGTSKVVDGRSLYTGQGGDAADNNSGSEAGGSQGNQNMQTGGSQVSEGVGSQGGGKPSVGSEAGGSQGSVSQGGGSQPGGSQVGVGGSQVGVGSQSSGTEGGGSQSGGIPQVGQRRMGTKVVSKVRGRSQRILMSMLAKVTPGPGLTPEDAMHVE